MNSAVTQFQSAFAARIGSTYAFAFWKARVALYAVLKAMGVGQGDEVILPGYTCVMNVNPIKYLGAIPIYVDIDPATYNIDPKFIEERISSKTKVIIAQHTYGYPCNMDAIMAIANQHNIPVVEDCCLTLGSTYRGQLTGTFGVASYYSFQWNKPFTTGLGGMALTSDDELAATLQAICDEAVLPSAKQVAMLAAQLAVYRAFIYPRTTALAQTIFRTLSKKGVVVGSSSNAEFEPVIAEGFLKRMSGLQARSGLKQLAKLDAGMEHRKRMAALYDELLTLRGWQARVYDDTTISPVMVRYPIRIKEKEKALAEAASNGIELGSWFECPLHPIETPMEKYDYKVGQCPRAEKASQQVVNLPLHPRVSEKTVRKTVEFICRYTQVS
jgi:perosamine synthetase